MRLPPAGWFIPVLSKSSRVMATYQPRFTSPSTFCFGIRTLSKNSSLKELSPLISWMGRTVMPGSVHVQKEEGYAPMFHGASVRAGQKEHVVGVLRVARPYLLSVDHVFIAVFHRAGLQRRKVGPRAWLAESLAPNHLTLGYVAQVCPLLLLRAVYHQGRAQEVEAEGVEARGAAVFPLLIKDELGHGGRALAAILLGPTYGVPALFGQHLPPFHLSALIDVGKRYGAANPVGGQLLVEEVPYLLAKGYSVLQSGASPCFLSLCGVDTLEIVKPDGVFSQDLGLVGLR